MPELKPNGLDSVIAKQFADIQHQLMGLMKEQDTSKQSMQKMMMDCMSSQQTNLLDAMESLMGMVLKSVKTQQPSESMVMVLQDLKQTITNLPGDLKDALDQQYQQAQAKTMQVSVAPKVTVAMPQGFLDRIDSLESALLHGLRRSRSRTFGSNY